MTKRFTIERDPPASRPNSRFMGHNAAGQFGWLDAFMSANVFACEEDAEDFIRHRLVPRGVNEGRVVAHAVH